MVFNARAETCLLSKNGVAQEMRVSGDSFIAESNDNIVVVEPQRSRQRIRITTIAGLPSEAKALFNKVAQNKRVSVESQEYLRGEIADHSTQIVAPLDESENFARSHTMNGQQFLISCLSK